MPVSRCFIGSCANGQLEDLADAARILKGRTVSAGCQLVVTPASQRVFSQALSLGYVQALVDAGAVVTNPACGACFGYDLGVLGDNEVCLTASTRNFKGRMGSAQAQIFMASPATVAASALTGCITDPQRRPMSIPPLKGRVWVFGDKVDTDSMFPGRGLRLPPEEAAQLLMDGIRPGWASQVSPGDVIVGGEQFGMGSARPVGTLLRLVGIGAVMASSMSSIFQRNCINAGLLAVPVPGVDTFCHEGDILDIDAEGGVMRNLTVGTELEFAPIPAFVSEIVTSGGIVAQLTKGGYLRA